MSDYFQMNCDSPYMLLVAPVLEKRRLPFDPGKRELWGIDLLNVPRSDIPSVTHIDYSARIQTVHEETNSRYYKLLKAFEEKTGYATCVNTSFNVRGEPIVCTPEDAYRCFMRTEMDVLVIENYVLRKEDQKPLEGDSDWTNPLAASSGRYCDTRLAGSIRPSAISSVARVPKNDFVTEKAICSRSGVNAPK